MNLFSIILTTDRCQLPEMWQPVNIPMLCLPVKMASKTVISPIVHGGLLQKTVKWRKLEIVSYLSYLHRQCSSFQSQIYARRDTFKIEISLEAHRLSYHSPPASYRPSLTWLADDVATLKRKLINNCSQCSQAKDRSWVTEESPPLINQRSIWIHMWFVWCKLYWVHFLPPPLTST